MPDAGCGDGAGERCRTCGGKARNAFGPRPAAVVSEDLDGAGIEEDAQARRFRAGGDVTILLLAVANFNSFIIPWIMTGGGPSNASHIWITHIYELAFGRQRWGVASAYSVLLFLILMSLGYFYVRALSGNERKDGSA